MISFCKTFKILSGKDYRTSGSIANSYLKFIYPSISNYCWVFMMGRYPCLNLSHASSSSDCFYCVLRSVCFANFSLLLLFLMTSTACPWTLQVGRAWSRSWIRSLSYTRGSLICEDHHRGALLGCSMSWVRNQAIPHNQAPYLASRAVWGASTTVAPTVLYPAFLPRSPRHYLSHKSSKLYYLVSLMGTVL